MIYESLIVPTERPPSINDVKRALLTYDKVRLNDPSDRDLIPPNAFMSSLIGIPLFGANTGPVRPLGKVPGYDDEFDRLVSELDQPIKQGRVELITTFKESHGGFTIGAVDLGGFPLDPKSVILIYRAIATNQEFLKAASDGLIADLRNDEALLEAVSQTGKADGRINSDPALPDLIGNFRDEHLRGPLSVAARSRIGSFIKTVGFCQVKNIAPIFANSAQSRILELLVNNTKKFVDNIEEDDHFTARRARVLSIAHSEYIDDEILAKLSIADVISLRTKLWGRQVEKRAELFRVADSIAREASSLDDFNASIEATIKDYRAVAGELERERKSLNFQIKCDLCQALLAGAAGEGVLASLAGPVASVPALLLAGGIWAAAKAKEHLPQWQELRRREEAFEQTPGYAIENYFRDLG